MELPRILGRKRKKNTSKPPEEAVEKLPPDQKDYIKKRFDQYQNWYDNKAVTTKSRY